MDTYGVGNRNEGGGRSADCPVRTVSAAMATPH